MKTPRLAWEDWTEFASMTQEEAAARIGVSRGTFNSWLAGRSFPGPRNRRALAALFGLAPGEIVRERSS